MEAGQLDNRGFNQLAFAKPSNGALFMMTRIALLACLLFPLTAAAQPATTNRDAACWKPAYTDCVATTKGDVAGSKGCYGNYGKCIAAQSSKEATCWKEAFTACVATTDGGVAGVTGCHGNYLKCLAK